MPYVLLSTTSATRHSTFTATRSYYYALNSHKKDKKFDDDYVFVDFRHAFYFSEAVQNKETTENRVSLYSP